MKSTFFIPFLLASQIAWSQIHKNEADTTYSPGIENLLNQPDRPTVEQLEAIVDELQQFTESVESDAKTIIERNQNHPFLVRSMGGLNQDTGTADHIKTHLPSLIVALEKAFPNGTYAFLGRDVNLWGDALHSFYRSQKQMDRVKFLNASTATFANTTQEQLVTFFIAERT